MKSILYIIILSVIAPLFIACSEDFELMRTSKIQWLKLIIHVMM